MLRSTQDYGSVIDWSIYVRARESESCLGCVWGKGRNVGDFNVKISGHIYLECEFKDNISIMTKNSECAYDILYYGKKMFTIDYLSDYIQ